MFRALQLRRLAEKYGPRFFLLSTRSHFRMLLFEAQGLHLWENVAEWQMREPDGGKIRMRL